jgi:hypothetical protein
MVVGVYIVVLDVNLAYISKQTAGASHLKPMMYHSFIIEHQYFGWHEGSKREKENTPGPRG